MNKIERALRNRRLLVGALCSCVSLFVVANAAPALAQNDGSATMRVIKPFIGFEETFQWSEAPEILRGADQNAEAKPGEEADDYSWASDLFFEKEIWQLQFSYKTVRTIDVDFPTKDGKLETKRVWYLVYSATNTGKRLGTELDSDVATDVTQKVVDPKTQESVSFDFPSNNLMGVHRPKYIDSAESIRFAPRFVLASSSVQGALSYERDPETGMFFGQKKGASSDVYYDEFLPLAFAKIVEKEARPGQTFVDSVRVAKRAIKPGETVWGVATWVGIDPRIDKFSVYISGLTNALRWDISAETNDSDSQVGAGRDIMRKVLKLNFINPGDEAHSGGKEIYNYLPGELDYQWIYL